MIRALPAIKRFLRTFPMTKPCYLAAYRIWSNNIYKKKAQQLQTEGLSLLTRLLKDLGNYHTPVFIAYGTLLGVIREKGFIPHDCDVDFGIVSNQLDDLKDFLFNKGYKITHGFEYQNNLVEFSIDINGINIDFFRYENREDLGFGSYVFHSDSDLGELQGKERHVAFVSCTPITNTITYEVSGIDFIVPENFEKYLSDIYTENWRIPDPNWVARKGPAWHDLHGEVGYEVEFSEAT